MLHLTQLAGFGVGGDSATWTVPDPYIASVTMGSHGEGADGVQVPANMGDIKGGTGLALTSGVTYSTSFKKVGNTSMYFDGVGTGYRQFADAVGWEFGAGAFTIEAWMNPSDVTVKRGIIGRSDLGLFSWTIHQNVAGGISFNWSTNGTIGTNTLNTTNGILTAGVWYHLAVVRETGGDFVIYVNGTSEGRTSAFGTTALFDITAVTNIGVVYNDGSVYKGYMDELRITKGVCRYTGNFTPSTAPFADA